MRRTFKWHNVQGQWFSIIPRLAKNRGTYSLALREKILDVTGTCTTAEANEKSRNSLFFVEIAEFPFFRGISRIFNDWVNEDRKFQFTREKHFFYVRISYFLTN